MDRPRIRRSLPLLLLAVTSFGVLSLTPRGIAQTEAGSTGLPYGEYRLSPPTDGRAWPLPPPGDAGHNACESGTPVAARWSPDGRYLAVEVDAGLRIGLCLYDLAAFSFGGKANSVVVRAVSGGGIQQNAGSSGASPAASGSAGAMGESTASGASSAFDRFSRPGAAPTLDSDYGLRWNPDPRQGPLFVFSRRNQGNAQRVMGVMERGLLSQARVQALDRPLGATVRVETRFGMPAWGPLPRSGLSTLTSSGGPDLTLVTDWALGRCGRERLVSLTQPGSASSRLVPLSHPCQPRSERLKGSEGADRAPVWDPVLEHDRLAFVRAAPGQIPKLCLLEGHHLKKESRLSCRSFPGLEHDAIPTQLGWTADGRTLYYYATVRRPGTNGRSGIDGHPASGDPSDLDPRRRTVRQDGQSADGAAGEVQVRLETLDLEAGAEPTRRVVVSGVHPNDWQEAGTVRDRLGASWALVLREDPEGLRNKLEAVWISGPAAPTAASHPIGTGLQNVRVVDGVLDASGRFVRLALIAQGPTGRRAADVSGYKLYLLSVDVEPWR